ncbi:hypothetical protein NBRC111894_4583 [Sporolactobacillus inulinus]|uniref:Uncharacterized protein n=1 Tax=Sporolactobacillus inulinus TaxID=2078 RepID=A0A4Y1ZJ25_9BACL|nr:hypothetical protein NBRC111894_4583 [Sporolactobacillus inulinus]
MFLKKAKKAQRSPKASLQVHDQKFECNRCFTGFTQHRANSI